MRFDLHLRAEIKQRLETLAAQMSHWESKPWINDTERKHLLEAIQPFAHTAKHNELRIAGVDGSGDFPSVAYGDSFVYVTVAQATCYAADPVAGLREVAPGLAPVVEFTWLPGDEAQSGPALEQAFAALAGTRIREVIERSDYRVLKEKESGRANTVAGLHAALIKPHASDVGNLAIQLRSTGELGAALRMIRSEVKPDYVLIDSTLSLPFVSKDQSLFYEHMKRLCCVEARNRGIGFFALSKSHGLPGIDLLEDIVREKLGIPAGKTPEHWYLRLPIPGVEGELAITQGRRVPPPGAVSYLVRFHRNTPIMRLDMDYEYWRIHVSGEMGEETRAKERHIFEALDYAGHAYQCYGYPYPLKASHDRASLTEAERVTLRKQIIDAAVRTGMKRSLFRDPSQATGHR